MHRNRLAPVTLALSIPFLLAGCPPETNDAPPGGLLIEAGAPTTPPDRVVGRGSGPLPCASAVGLVNQTITNPPMTLTGSPERPLRSRIQSGSGTYSYGLAAVNPLTCQISGLQVPTQTVTFAFTYIRDVTSTSPLCVETSILTVDQFDPALSNALIAAPFKASLWSTIESNALIAPGGRCSNWIETPAPYWP